MPNILATPQWTVNDTAASFVNSTQGIANFNRTYDDSFVAGGAKVGMVVNARLPVRFYASFGSAYDEQAINEPTTPISLNQPLQVAFGGTSIQYTMELDRIRERYTMPAGLALANAADVFGMDRVYRLINNMVGTPGTTPSTTQVWFDAGVKLSDGAVPVIRNRVAVIDTQAMARLANTTSLLFNPTGEISGNYKTGMLNGQQLGIEAIYQDQNIPRHTTGGWTGNSTPIINGASQTGSSIVTSGWNAGTTTLRRGDIVSFANVFSVNPVSWASTGRLAQFTLTADVSDAAGAITLPISPSLIPVTGTINTNSLANVTASPANSAAITFWGTTGTFAFTATVSPQSLLFTKDFAAFVMADLVEPDGGATCSYARSKDKNVMIRYVKQFSALADKQLNRMDCLVGADILQARFACRVAG